MNECNNLYNNWSQRIPIEILLNIFKIATFNDGPIPFLCRVAKVCRLWRLVCRDLSLWVSVDLSYGWIRKEPKYLQKLINNQLKNVQYLNLSGWTMLKSGDFQLIANQCCQLKYLNVSQTKIDSDTLINFVLKCHHLDSFNLTSMKSSLTPQILVDLVDRKRSVLRNFIFSKNVNCRFNSVLKSMMLTCPSLEHLELDDNDLSRQTLIIFDIKQMQKAWPNLKILRITNDHICLKTSQSKILFGFPKLIELSLTQTKISSSSSHEILNQLLCKSEKLEHLDLRYSEGISIDYLQRLPIFNLKYLYIKTNYIIRNIYQILYSCKDSLIELDLAWNTFDEGTLGKGLGEISSLPDNKLQVLNLKGTNVLPHTVQSILNGCANLQHICLDSCRFLTRGIKRTYYQPQFSNLLSQFDNSNSYKRLKIV